MEEQKHTPEPWIVTGSERIKYVEARVESGMLQEVAACMIVEHGDYEANARRIVACVNAFAGFPIEQIENGPDAILVAALAMKGRAYKAEQQRDELLAALKMMRDEFAGLPHSLGYDLTHLPQIDVLIAKTEATK